MKTARQAVLITLLTLLTSGSVQATGNVKIIANPGVNRDSISVNELKSLFLEETRSLSDGSHAEPVLEKDGPVHEAFIKEFLGKSSDDLENFYRALVFTGKGSMPRELGTDSEVVAYVAKTRGAIGYVSNGVEAQGVKTLRIEEGDGQGGQRKLITRIEPEYPETLKQLKIGGTVRLQVKVLASGKVATAEVLGGNPILGEAAQRAVRQWIYKSGHASSTIELIIPFTP